MKKYIIGILILCSCHCFSQSWDELVYEAKKENIEDNTEQAAILMKKAAELKEEDNFEWFWYSGVLYARMGKLEESFEMLEKAIEAGMYDSARWKRNSHLEKLHTRSRWNELLEKMRVSEASYSTTLSHPKLRQELKQMWVKEQDLVGQWDKQRKVVDVNTTRLNEIIIQYGWPTASMVGKDGSWMAWAIVQHSHDINFQKKCLHLMKGLLFQEKVAPVLYAELYDRICKNTSRKQRYGMALVKANGTKSFYEIQDIENVDKRRKSIGLSPLKVYANTNLITY